jgi:hypothetical protein
MDILSAPMMKFASLVIAGERPQQAAVMAGYEAKRAANLLRARRIQTFIAEEQNYYREKYRLEREQLVQMLLAAHCRATSATEEIAATRELGRFLGLYPTSKKTVTKTRQIETLSDSELLRIARGN